jgi:hypothetical protein
MSTKNETEPDLHPSQTIKAALTLYGSIFVIGFLFWSYRQRRLQHVYACRNQKVETASKASESNTMFGWIKPAWMASDDDIMEYCGLDTLVFLRVLKIGQKIALCGIFLSAMLFPVYATDDHLEKMNPNKTEKVDPLLLITMSNLGSEDMRLWSSVVAMYVISLYAMFLFRAEWQNYVVRRHQYLSRDDPQQYTVTCRFVQLSSMPMYVSCRTHMP